jgi:hypothetical protein
MSMAVASSTRLRLSVAVVADARTPPKSSVPSVASCVLHRDTVLSRGSTTVCTEWIIPDRPLFCNLLLEIS